MKNKLVMLIIITLSILSVVFIWRYFIGFEIKNENTFKKVIKDVNTASNFNIIVTDNRTNIEYDITNVNDVNEIIRLLADIKVVYSRELWIGGGYKISIRNNNTNEEIKIHIHPVNITFEDNRYDIKNEDGLSNYYKIEEIIKKYI